jgi:hypothetical protein
MHRVFLDNQSGSQEISWFHVTWGLEKLYTVSESYSIIITYGQLKHSI